MMTVHAKGMPMSNHDAKLLRVIFDTNDTAELEALASEAIQDHRLPRQKVGHLLQLAIQVAVRNQRGLAGTAHPDPLTDAEFIELLWKCSYWGAELMQPDIPDSNLRREWSDWMEQATVERHRRTWVP